MRAVRAWPWLLAAGVAACGDENRTRTAFTPAAERTRTSSNDTAPYLSAVTPQQTREVPPQAPAGPLQFALAGDGGGAVHLTPGEDGTTLYVSLQGGVPEAHYDGALRLGGCDAPGTRVSTLIPISTDAGGQGAAHSDAAVPTALLLATPHSVTYRDGSHILCGEIPRS